MRALKALLVLLGPVALLLVLVFNLDLGRFSPQLEKLVSNLLGRELRVSGPLSLTLDLDGGLELHTSDAGLAATSWSTQAELISLRELQLRLDFWSFFGDGPVVIDRLVADGLRIYLEEDEEGNDNWTLFDDEEEDDDEEPFEIPVHPGNIQLSDSLLSYMYPERENPLVLHLDSVADSVAKDGKVQLAMNGKFNDRALTLAITSTSVEEILDLRDVEAGLQGTLGQVSFKGDFAVADLLEPRRPRVDIALDAPSSEYFLRALDLTEITSGPLSFTVGVKPEQDSMRFKLQSVFGEFTAHAEGEFDDLQALQDFRFEAEAEGPSLGHLLDLLGLEDVPDDPFTLTAKVNSKEGDIDIEDLTLAVDKARLVIAAELDDFPDPKGAKGTASIDIPDLSRFAALLALPGELPGSLEADAELKPVQDGAALKLTAHSNDISLDVDGNILDTEDYVGSDLNYKVSGASLTPVFDALALTSGPALPFSMEGQGRRIDKGIELGDTSFSMQSARASLSGTVGNDPLQDDTSLVVELNGPDLTDLYAMLGLAAPGAPAEPYSARAEVEARGGELILKDYSTVVGEAKNYEVKASGTVTDLKKLEISHWQVTVRGESLAGFLAPAQIEDLPSVPFDIDLLLDGHEGGYFIDHAKMSLAKEKFAVQGSVDRELTTSGTHVKFESSSPAVKHFLESFGVILPQLAEGELRANGSLEGKGESFDVDAVVDFAGTRIKVDGGLGDLGSLEGLALNVDIRGANLAWVMPPGKTYPNLAYPFTMSGRVESNDELLSIKAGSFGLEKMRLHVDGEVSLYPVMENGRLKLSGSAQNITPLLRSAMELDTPDVLPISLEFAGSWKDELWTIDALDVQSGADRLTANGRLVGPPHFGDTRMAVTAKIANLATMSAFAGEELPALATNFKMNLEGTGDALELKEFDLQLGGSDLSGNLVIAEGEVPKLTGSFSSRVIDMNELFPRSAPDKAVPAQNVSSSRRSNKRVIPDTPVPMDLLGKLDADVNLDLAELRRDAQVLRSVDLDAVLKDGVLTLKHLSLETSRGGTLGGGAYLGPSDYGPRFGFRIFGEDLSLLLPAETQADLEKLPTYKVKTALRAHGHTVREMAENANGYFRLEMGKGKIKSGGARILTSDFLVQLTDTLNPFTKQDPYSKVQCGVVLAKVEEGKISGDPFIVMRNSRIDLTAKGNIDLHTEKLEAHFHTTPRKGLGFSVSSLINPYVMASGTLGNPNIAVDPEGVIVQGGVAIATAGLSVVAKGLKDRFFSAKDPCGTAALDANDDQQAMEDYYSKDPLVN